MFRYTRSPLHNYALLPRASLDHIPQTHDDVVFDHREHASKSSWLDRLTLRISGVKKLSDPAVYTHYVTPRHRRRSVLRLFYYTIFSIPYILLCLVLFAGVFFPSYTVRPDHYNHLRRAATESTLPGRANTNNEKVFIAAALSENKGDLTSGPWGKAVLQLVDLLGPENVHLSVYEDNTDAETKISLDNFRARATCNATIVSEKLDLASLPHITLPSGESRLKRITFLAEVRNRALAPIDDNGVRFDKVLYLNDVIFDPVEAAQLLFATNVDATGRANYAAACAVDFIMPFKFYDRFATRDYDGHITGLPFFPWFTSAGTAISRKEAMAGKDAVRVRSCWGGMTAFEAKWFQNQAAVGRKPVANSTTTQLTSQNPQANPLRFRYVTDTFWEGSECCLINADIQYRRSGQGMPEDSGIYMNPFVRVAYDAGTLKWLSFIRRPERLYAPIHDILNYFVGFPEEQLRFNQEPGQLVTETEWVYDHPARGLASNATEDDLKGHFQQVKKVADVGGWCSGPNLLVMNEKPEHGPGHWSKIWPPHPPRD